MRSTKQQIGDEIWSKCSEYLEMIPEESWDQFLVPVISKMLLRERERCEYYKMRLDAISLDKIKVWE